MIFHTLLNLFRAMLDQLDIRTPALPATLLDPNLPANLTNPHLRQPAAASGTEVNMPALLDQVLPALPDSNASKVFYISSACIFGLRSCFLFPVSCFLFPVFCFLFPVSCFYPGGYRNQATLMAIPPLYN